MIVILDLGSHENTVVARAIRALGVYSEIYPHDITANELKGSTFTVSSTGKEGGFFATPITNYPEVAILGVHKITKEPVVINDELAIGHTMTVSCTFDHRVIDGEPAGKFMRDIAAYLEHPSRFAL